MHRFGNIFTDYSFFLSFLPLLLSFKRPAQSLVDPKIKGVELYISNFDRPITEKLSGANLFNDPAYASVACAKTAKVVAIADTIAKGPGGEEVFEESRSLLFKTLRVQRIYDTDTNTVVYVSFNTRLDKNDDTNKSRFKSSLCAVNLNDS
jgi:catabolite regulation protein CreA